MIIKVKQTTTTEKEIEINFPYVTFDITEQKYFYNYEFNKCIQLSYQTGSIIHTRYSNEGLTFPQISKEIFYSSFDSNLQFLLNILNK
jgi:hypothetical protein